MNFSAALLHVLRHAWLWPIEFWLRPLDVIDRMLEKPGPEIFSALLGGVLFGSILGIGVWLLTGETQAIWILSVAVAVAVAFAVAGAVAGAVAVVGAGAGAVLYFSLVIGIGFALGVWLPVVVPFLLASIGVALLIDAVMLVFGKELFSDTFRGIVYFFLLPIAGFGTVPESTVAETPIWTISVVVSISVGVIAGLFETDEGIWRARKTKNLNRTRTANFRWMVLIWTIFPLLALAAWFPDIHTAELNTKLDTLAVFLALTPPILTGLIFWPFVSLVPLWQFRSRHVIEYNENTFASSLPFRWQTFAYPLPGLRHYLISVCSKKGPEIALKAIQDVQCGTLQIGVARRAAFDLAALTETALPFSGQVALSTNTRTLIPLSLAGPAARAVAVLAKKAENEDEQPLRLFVTEYPSGPSGWTTKFQPKKRISASWEKFGPVRSEVLPHRIRYALGELDTQPDAAQVPEFRNLLNTLLMYAESDLLGISRIVERPISDPLEGKEEETSESWLGGGCEVLKRIKKILMNLNDYRDLGSRAARRELLEHIIESLESLNFEDLANSHRDSAGYWGNVGKELAAIWIARLSEEAKQATEWLRLEIHPPSESCSLGTQSLPFRVVNPTGIIAQNLRIRVEETPGIEWHNVEAKRSFLEDGAESRLKLEMEVNQAGSYRIAGRLEAEDLSGNPFVLPFAFQIRVAESGRPYKVPRYQPYQIGEGLGDDRTFVGRQNLLYWLRGLWLAPGAKPAVVLVGQRRIGKTSLLNKISRHGLPDTGLLPVLINIQGVAGDYDFLSSVAGAMATHLDLAKPTLDESNPYSDFKDFLLGLKPILAERRFLLMLDEADLIPERHLGDLLPGFLRALMQEPQYPTLLLFCGTHRLKQSSRDYSSILFNTAQFRTVSYMTEAESAEVLEKPARDILEYDPASLAEAYRRTRGQPLLLQSLGATLIDTFNAKVLDGGERSNYVSLSDLNSAAEKVAQSANAAFEQHWNDSGVETHRVLSTLAWATDEDNRPQLDLIGIESHAAGGRLGVSEGRTFKIVERLADEETLIRKGPTYCFAVPLYRRWIAWRWPPDRVREER